MPSFVLLDQNTTVMVIKVGTMAREMGMVPLEIEGNVMEISEVHSEVVEVEDGVDLIKVQMSDAQE